MTRTSGEGFDGAYSRSGDYFGAEPDPLLVRFLDEIPPGGRVLDVGAGQGRHAIWLARRGFRVCAVDPSAVAAETVSRRARAEGLDLDSRQCGFDVVEAEEVFDAVLIFGLLPLLDSRAVDLLSERLAGWLRGGGVAFVTAFSTAEKARAPSRDWLLVEADSLWRRLGAGGSRFTWEGLGPLHRHGSGPPERHAMIEAVLCYSARGS